jgi:cytochrome c553
MLRFGWLNRSVTFKTIIVVFAVLGAVVALFVFAGGVDVSADKPDGWLARTALHLVFKRSEGARGGEVTPPSDLAAPSRVRLAAQQFDMECANCHGRPGFGQSAVALSMSPRPQYLPKVVGQFTDRELYTIVEHGVKYSAMPSWLTDSRGDEVWSMVAFLRQLPHMNADAYRTMTAPPATVKPALPAISGDATLRPANARENAPPVDEFLYAAPSAGFSDQSIHDNPVATCARCHGADGSGDVTGGEAPNLTLQSAAYLHAALDAYTRGTRKSGFMQNIATQLSSAQITALSTYYAGLPAKAASSPPADPALVKRGETISAQGLPHQAIPPCASCHESAGAQITGAPHIAGQSATYLLRQLRAMGRGGRGSTVGWNPMVAVAHDLDAKDVAALAAYYSSLKPAKGSTSTPVAPSPQPAGSGAGLAAAKQTFATVCMKCHVNGGRGDIEGDYPNLTLQTTPYMAQSLYAYRTGVRRSVKMRETTNSLTFDQLADIAAYLNSLQPRRALAKVDADAAARGAVIATKGVPGRGVAACLSCHGETGVNALPLIPRLQGQNGVYLAKKLNSFARPYGARPNALNPMPAIASALTERERADLAAYFAAAPLAPKPARP